MLFIKDLGNGQKIVNVFNVRRQKLRADSVSICQLFNDIGRFVSLEVAYQE
jgi:hypothetical protein